MQEDVTLHSPIGASSCERWWNCPGSFQLAQQLPTPPSSFYAAEGTAAHSVGEWYLRRNRPVDNHFLGKEIKVVEHDKTYMIHVDEGMLEAVDEYVTFIFNTLEEYCLDHSALQVEKGFNLAHIDKEAFGTCDANIIAPLERLIVVDYKHGAGVPVEAEWNKQTLYYGVGAYFELPPKDREYISHIETVIVQPRAPHSGGSIRKAIYTIDEILEWQSELHGAVTRIRTGITTLKAGKWCKWCPAKLVCPEARAEIERQALIDFDMVAAPLPKVKNLTPEELANLLDHAKYLKDWCNDVLTYGYSMAEAGMALPGYKLVSGRSNRKWKDESEVASHLLNDQGFNPADIYTQKILSPAQMEKMVKKYKIDLSPYWEKPEPKKTLVRNADQREERNPAVVDDWADVDVDLLDI